MLIQIVFPHPGHDGFIQRERRIRRAANADKLNTVDGLRALTADVCHFKRQAARAVAGNSQMVGQRVVRTRFGVHDDAAVLIARIVAVNGKCIADVVTARDLQRALVGHVTIDGIARHRCGSVLVAADRIPGRQQAARGYRHAAVYRASRSKRGTTVDINNACAAVWPHRGVFRHKRRACFKGGVTAKAVVTRER